MKKLSAIISILLIIALLTSSFGVQAKRKEYKYEKYTYILLDDGTAEITWFSGSNKEDIPSYVDGHKVSTLGPRSLMFAKIVIIPETVSKISKEAFGYSCSVKKISVSKDNSYFSSDSAGVLFNKKKTTLRFYPGGREEKSYDIPDGVKKIADSAFHDAPIEAVTFPDTLEYIGARAFSGCSLKKVSVPPSVREIGDYAFSDWDTGKLSKITLNEGLEIIGKYAFEYTAITSLNIPSTVKKIGSCALYTESLKKITVTEGNHTDEQGALYDRGKKALVVYPHGKTPKGTFTVPEGIEKISAKAFYGTGLESVSLPEGLKEIGAYAFADCFLYEVALPSTVKKLGSHAFSDCENQWLKIVKLNEGLEEIGDRAFEDTAIKKIRLPSSLKAIGKYAFSGSKLEKVEFPAGLKTISAGTFCGCSKLTKVTLHKGLREIGSGAFSGCGSLTKITFPKTLEIIGNDAFCHTGLTEIKLPASVKEISPGAFSKFNYNSKIRKISVAKSSKYFTVKSNVLYDKKCKTLIFYPPKTPKRSFTTPKTVRKIEKYACVGAKFNKLIITGNVRRIGKEAFFFMSANDVANKNGLRYIERYAFWEAQVNRKNGWSLKLPASVRKIGECAFWDSNLSKVNIPKSMTEIVSNTFHNTLLTEITIPPTVKKIGYGAFDGPSSEYGPYIQDYFTIYGKKGSAAEKYAKEIGVKFVRI